MSTKIQKISGIDKNNRRKVFFLELFFVISQIERHESPPLCVDYGNLWEGKQPEKQKNYKS